MGRVGDVKGQRRDCEWVEKVMEGGGGYERARVGKKLGDRCR